MQRQSGAVSVLTDLPHLQWETRILGQSSLPFFHPPSVMTYVTILPRGQAGSVLIFHKLAESGKEVIRLTKELASIAAEILWGFLISPPIMTSSAHHQRRLDLWKVFLAPVQFYEKLKMSFYFLHLKFLANIQRNTVSKGSHCVCLKSVLLSRVI